MASYSFEAEPKVVSHRIKKYKDNPQDLEKNYIQEQKKLKQREMMERTLLLYKSQAHKATPYDIRPGPTNRIEVDLSYFLTDIKQKKPQEQQVECQTDEFQQSPPPSPYKPKKTGVDVSTQIWDGELFNFDFEVQPILNVLVHKTLE